MNVKESDGRLAAQEEIMDDVRKLNKRYTLVAWGALFIWIGVIWLVPGVRVPIGTGLLGIGIILLGVNLARYLINKIPPNWSDITLGIIVLALGAAELLHSQLPFSIGLIVIGVVLLVRSVAKRSSVGCCFCI